MDDLVPPGLPSCSTWATAASMVLALSGCECQGELVTPSAPPAPPPGLIPESTLLASLDQVQAAHDEGESLLVVSGGQLTRVAKDGSATEELWHLGERSVRGLVQTTTHLVLVHFPRGATGQGSVVPPGVVEALPLIGGEPLMLSEEATTSTHVAASGDVLWLAERASLSEGTRVARYDQVGGAPSQRWLLPELRVLWGIAGAGGQAFVNGRREGMPTVLALEPDGGVRLLWSTPDGILALHTAGENLALVHSRSEGAGGWDGRVLRLDPHDGSVAEVGPLVGTYVQRPPASAVCAASKSP